MSVRLIDVYPARGTFTPGERVQLIAEVDASAPAALMFGVSIFHLSTPIAHLEIPFALKTGRQNVMFEWDCPPDAPRAYGVEVRLIEDSAQTSTTAFDVLPHWTLRPRYGFLTDFAPGRKDSYETLCDLARFHINAVQFYDWMYRHDQLLPPSEPFSDPLGRALSLDTTCALIDAAHAHGIAAMPYTAVYAASPEFHRAHPDWGLYHVDGKAFEFADGFLFYMNPATDSPWSLHLLDQFDVMLRALDFDGVHIDQYGDPMMARDAQGNTIALDKAFRAFIDATVERVQTTVVFNCVGNWPIATVAHSRAHFMYIEVWPPFTLWRDLWRLIVEAQRLSAKPVVLAAYIDPAHEHNVRLADAIIFASGGTHIELGEQGGVLADPYFPKYGKMSAVLRRVMRAYYDFAIRYEELLALDTHDATREWSGRVWVNGSPADIDRTHDGLWSIVREREGVTAISLINLSGVEPAHWNEALASGPTALESITVRLIIDRAVANVWWASPDGDSPRAAVAAMQDTRGDTLEVTLPYLLYWTLIVLEWES